MAAVSKNFRSIGCYATECFSVCLGALSTAWDFICRSALCARERELPSTARRTNVPETSIFLVA